MSTTATSLRRTTELRAYPGWVVREYHYPARLADAEFNIPAEPARTCFNVQNDDESNPCFSLGLDTFQECIDFVRGCSGRKPRSATDDNPWKAQHIEREYAYCGGGYSREMARRAVEWEFEGAPDPIACKCGGTAHYRATVGVLKCASCGDLYHANGSEV